MSNSKDKNYQTQVKDVEEHLSKNELKKYFNQLCKQKQDIKDLKKKLEKIKVEQKNEIIEKNQFTKKQQRSFLNSNRYYQTISQDINLQQLCKNINTQIREFVQQHKIYTQKNEAKNKELVNKLKETISKDYPFLELRIYGSYQTDLAMPWSDIDLVLVDKGQDPNTQIIKETNSEIMNNNNKDVTFEGKYLESATIPIIKIKTSKKYKYKKVDITFKDQQDPKHYGEECVRLVQTFLQQYPSLKPLLLILKQLVYFANLHDPYLGGFSSYSLILMLVAFFQHKHSINNSKILENDNYGSLLIQFLQVYLNKQYSQLTVKALLNHQNVQSETIIDNIQQQQYIGSDKQQVINIVDPLNNINNVAKTSYNFTSLQYLLQFCYFSLFLEGNALENFFNAGLIYAQLK